MAEMALRFIFEQSRCGHESFSGDAETGKTNVGSGTLRRGNSGATAGGLAQENWRGATQVGQESDGDGGAVSEVSMSQKASKVDIYGQVYPINPGTGRRPMSVKIAGVPWTRR